VSSPFLSINFLETTLGGQKCEWECHFLCVESVLGEDHGDTGGFPIWEPAGPRSV
jgi:hypothetical protein